MKKTARDTKKLVLDRTTIRTLAADQLVRIDGGWFMTSSSSQGDTSCTYYCLKQPE